MNTGDVPSSRHRVVFVLPIALFLAVQLWAFGALATTPAGESAPTPIYVTLAYVIGTLTAIVYKMAVGSTKHLAGRTFRLRALLLPVAWSVLLSFPLVFVIMPKFGRPSGVFVTDVIYAYLTTYAMIDMTADFFTIYTIIQRKFIEAADRDARESHPGNGPSA